MRGKILPKDSRLIDTSSSAEIPFTTEGSSAPEGDGYDDIMAGIYLYKIQVERVFKGEDILGLIRHAVLDTLQYGANCGRMLKEGKVYVLSGMLM